MRTRKKNEKQKTERLRRRPVFAFHHRCGEGPGSAAAGGGAGSRRRRRRRRSLSSFLCRSVHAPPSASPPGPRPTCGVWMQRFALLANLKHTGPTTLGQTCVSLAQYKRQISNREISRERKRERETLPGKEYKTCHGATSRCHTHTQIDR